MSVEQSLPEGVVALEAVQEVFHIADLYFESQEQEHFNSRPTTHLSFKMENGKVKVQIQTTKSELAQEEAIEMAGRINYGVFADNVEKVVSYLQTSLEQNHPNFHKRTIIEILTGRLKKIKDSSNQLRNSHVPGAIGNQEMMVLWGIEELFKNPQGSSMEYAGTLIQFLED